MRGNIFFALQISEFFLQVPEIDDRSDITGLRQIVGIIVQLADVADQDCLEEIFH